MNLLDDGEEVAVIVPGSGSPSSSKTWNRNSQEWKREWRKRGSAAVCRKVTIMVAIVLPRPPSLTVRYSMTSLGFCSRSCVTHNLQSVEMVEMSVTLRLTLPAVNHTLLSR